MTTKFDELVAKLKEIFQIDKPELDFGIYKILHARAAEINDFLEHKLKVQVEAVLRSHGQQDTKNALDTAKNELLQNVGADALETDGSVKQQYKALPIPAVKNAVENYEAALSAYQAAADSLKNETEVYSHLLEFFKRYYEEGDFVSKRRYKDGVYAIPYSGEEVKLHWANADQYYTKSGENFTNYRFMLEGGLKVEFKLISAQTGKDDIKDTEAVRRFVLWNPEAMADAELLEDGPDLPPKAVEEKDGTLEIYFRYLKIAKPKKGDGKKVTQESFVEEAEKAIAAAIKADNALKTKYQALFVQVSQDDKRTRLRKYLADYTAKNTNDYFIHKNLKVFLERELDYYVKTEMFKLDRIDEAATIKDIETNLHVIQAFRSIALVLIGFLAQLENFQKKLWLKKKFVTSCEYCITMDRIPDELKPEVLQNQEQLDEWKNYGIDVDPATVDMHALDARMVDTKFFDEEFKAKLLRSIPDLDDKCDGLLIHSDNYQALNLLQERFHSACSGIHIDPPYNTDTSGFLYKNDYRHSSWMTMMDDRFRITLPLMAKESTYMCHIDENEYERLNVLLDSYPLMNPGTLIWDKRNPMTGGGGIAKQHEYVVCRSTFEGQLLVRSDNAKLMLKTVEKLIKNAGGVVTDEIRDQYRKWLKEQKSLSGGERAYCYIDDAGKIYSSVSLRAPEPRSDEKFHKPLIHPVTNKPCPVPPNGFSRTPETLQEMIAHGEILFGDDEKTQPRQKRILTPYSRVQLSSVIVESKKGTSDLKTMGLKFPYCHAVRLYDVIVSALDGDATGLVLDYFAGSGTTAHAIIDLNRKDAEENHGQLGKRKYILVEMGEHFDTVLMPRIKKVVYSPEWKDGKPKVYEKGISHCFKYMTLESYEDALNNIELRRTAEQESMLPGLNDDKYLLKYFLDVESRGSIISTDDFQKPFDYELKIAYESSGAAKPQKIDLVETFNYLIGLKVDSYVRRIDKGYCYLDGILPSGEHALVFWRDCDKLDAKSLNDELEKLGVDAAAKKATFDVIYVNGDHAVQNGKIKPAEGAAQLKVRQIETEFLEKMFACEEV